MLYIKSLAIRDFLPIEEFVTDFDSDVTLIYGSNASGKSSVLEAIKCALYGFQGRKKKAKTKSSYVRDGARDFNIRLQFNTGSSDVEVLLTGSKHELMYPDGRVDTENVPKKVGRLTGINRWLFEEVLFSRQGELAKFAEMSPTEKLKIFKKVAGISGAGLLADRLMESARVYLDGIPSPEDLGRVEREITELEQKLKEVREDITRVREELNLLEEQRSELEGYSRIFAALAEALRSISPMQKQVTESLQRIKSSLRKARDSVSQLGIVLDLEDVETTEDIESAMKVMEQCKEKIEADKLKVEKEMEQLLKELRQAGVQYDRIAGDAETVQGDLERVKNIAAGAGIVFTTGADLYRKLLTRQEKFHRFIVALEQGVARLVSRREFYVRAREQMQNESSCVLCGTQLTEDRARRLREELASKIASITYAISAASDKLSRYRKGLEETKKLLEDFEQARRSILRVCNRHGVRNVEALRQKLMEAGARVKETEKQIEELKKRSRMLEEASRSVEEVLHSIESHLRQEEALKEAVKRIEQLKDKTKSLPVPSAEEVSLRLQQVQVNIDDRKRSLEDLIRQESNIESRIRMLRWDLEKSKESARRGEVLRRSANALKLYEDRLTAMMLEVLPERVNDIVRQLGFEYRLIVDDESNFMVEKPTFSSPKSERVLSGAEKMGLGLAYRIALMEMFTDGAVLILDEPTYGFDKERLDLLVDLLKELKQTGVVSQMLIVSHEDRLIGCADRTIRLENGRVIEDWVAETQDQAR